MGINFYESLPFYISREKKTHSSISSAHYHDAYEILYLISGQIYYYVEDRTYQIVSGVLLFINMNDLHKLVNINGATFERVTLIFKKDFLSTFLIENEGYNLFSYFHSHSNAIKLGGYDQTFIEYHFNKMIQEETNKLPGYDYYQKVLLTELLLFLKRKVDMGLNLNLVESNRANKKISLILEFINHNYDKHVSLEDLSQNFSISPSHLSRTFKDVTGFTCIEYLNNIRMKEARSLLKDSKLSVSDIAVRVGFENLTHFGRIFKGTVGTTPLQYRKMSRASECCEVISTKP
ncbi:helix-turn-helix transcriptional regulator [Paenibacillus sp. GSMTC-2017]|uniref:AraC family transcriptional regulator n=1 Tax=Paenibacillus sp. GSMTC-2017 TaxID=2794350 RepID=UPI0018D87336|nr:AraC family transcriptional regulator [Paenibacillus sp. GSMTC-2017]MBH5316275.1 helix-turn-helix transcriptional regulator [Paenibacillus sp. GSMTC-2017]